MANRIKYDPQVDENALNMGNWSIGLNGVGDGPTLISNFYNGIEIPPGGYAIYTDGPQVRVAKNNKALINTMNALEANVVTLEGALMYAKASGILVLNNPFDSLTTDGLVAYMDAKHVTSFPKDGTTWYSVADSTKGLSDIRVLGFAHNYGAAKIYKYLENNTQFTSLGDYSTGYTALQNLNVEETAINYDLVVVESAAWSFGADVMQKLKDLVDAGVSVISNGNDNRTNVFVQSYDASGHAAHDIIMESDSLIGLDGKTFTYGSTDVHGGISVLQNGAIPLYRRADNNLIMGFVYHNEESGASLFFDQEWHNNYKNDIYMAAINYVVKNIGYSAKFVNTPVFEEATKSFSFDQANEYFNLSSTAVEDLSGSFTLMGFCRQGSTGAPHQTVIATSTGYRNGAKLMSRYHGPVALWIGNNDGTDSYVLSSGVDITNDDQWHHIAATRDSETGIIEVYVDGVLENTDKYVTGTISMTGDATIGVDYHSTGYHHTGNIASVKAYNRALTSDEILKDYYGSNIATTTGPSLVIDPANIKSYTTEYEESPGLGNLAGGGDLFRIEGTGSKVDEAGGILKLNSGRIYRENIGWFGKMSISWWMRYNGPVNANNFYTESHRTLSGCARIYSPLLPDGRFRFQVWDNSSSTLSSRTRLVETTTNVCDGTWHQVTCQWSNGTGNLRRGLWIYVDGTLEGYTDMVGNDGGYQHLHLGGSVGCTGDNVHNVDFGPIIHYKNYNLTANEVSQNYTAHVARFR